MNKDSKEEQEEHVDSQKFEDDQQSSTNNAISISIHYRSETYISFNLSTAFAQTHLTNKNAF